MAGIRIIASLAEIRRTVAADRRSSGLVPTLGALHAGHASLIKKARKENDVVIVSTFVNRLQFRKKQFLEYPRTPEHDAKIAEKAGADILFTPREEEIYPEGFSSSVTLPTLFRTLRHQKLEWHYRGVLTIVLKLFNLTQPDRAYFGMKDPHQLALIERMAEDFNIPVKIRRCPTVREKDGLARSSRNLLLTSKERKIAPVIYESLISARKIIETKGTGSINGAVAGIRRYLNRRGECRVEHVEITDAATLSAVSGKTKEILVFVAARIGSQRLTDNIRFRLPRS